MDAEQVAVHALTQVIQEAADVFTEEELREIFEEALRTPNEDPLDEFDNWSYGGSE